MLRGDQTTHIQNFAPLKQPKKGWPPNKTPCSGRNPWPAFGASPLRTCFEANFVLAMELARLGLAYLAPLEKPNPERAILGHSCWSYGGYSLGLYKPWPSWQNKLSGFGHSSGSLPDSDRFLRLMGALRINPWNNSALCAGFERALTMAGSVGFQFLRARGWVGLAVGEVGFAEKGWHR